MSDFDPIIPILSHEQERDEYVQELRRLLACYQVASTADKNVVWAALNKYAPLVQPI